MRQVVLLVEPDGGLRDMFRNILEEENFVVDAVQSMQQGQQHAQHYPYHYALVDMLLANQDDIDGVLSIHRSQPDMEILLLTDQPRVKKYFFDHGFAENGIKAILPSLFRLDDLFLYMMPLAYESIREHMVQLQMLEDRNALTDVCCTLNTYA
jgi:CheY-like chemotaxis protein